MRLKYKVVIFIMTVLISMIGFNLIASPSLCLLEMGKEAGYEIIGHYLANAEAGPPQVCYIDSRGAS